MRPPDNKAARQTCISKKYKKRKAPPSGAAVALLEIIGRHPEDVEMLKSLPVGQVEQPAAAREGPPSKVLAEPESGKGGITIRSSIG